MPAQLRSLQETGEIAVQETLAPPTDEEIRAYDEEEEEQPARALQHTASHQRALKVYAYGVSQNRLEQAARELQLPVEQTKDIRQANAVLTLKNYYRKKPSTIQEAE